MKEKINPTYTPLELKEIMTVLDSCPAGQQTTAEYIKWLYEQGYRIVKFKKI